MNECKPVVVLMLFSMKLVVYQRFFDAECQIWYRSAVGSLMWPATQCRPDIAYSVGVVSWYFSNPSKEHKWAVLQIFHYLKGTVDWGLVYTKNSSNHLVDYSDLDYAGDIITCQSIMRYVFYLTEDLIVYKLSLLKTVVLLTTESEYMALYMAAQKAMWIRGFFNHIGHTALKAVIIYEDNWSMIDFMKNPEVYSCSKHIDVHFH